MYNNLFKWSTKYGHKNVLVSILPSVTLSNADKVDAVLRGSLLSLSDKRLFAVWCVKQVKHLLTDKRSLAALDIAERFAHGKATQEELNAARAAAYAAVRAAYATANAAANAAARAAARAAAYAADAATYAATYAAAYAAHAAADTTAYAAANAAARAAQWNCLLAWLTNDASLTNQKENATC